MEDLTKRIRVIKKVQEQIDIIEDYRYQKQQEYWLNKCQKACSALNNDVCMFYTNMIACRNQGFQLDIENLKKNNFGFFSLFANDRFHNFIGFEYKNEFMPGEYHAGISETGMLRAFRNNTKKYEQIDIRYLPEDALKKLSEMLEVLPAFFRYEMSRMVQFVEELEKDTKKKLEEQHFTLHYEKDSTEEHEEYGE